MSVILTIYNMLFEKNIYKLILSLVILQELRFPGITHSISIGQIPDPSQQ